VLWGCWKKLEMVALPMGMPQYMMVKLDWSYRMPTLFELVAEKRRQMVTVRKVVEGGLGVSRENASVCLGYVSLEEMSLYFIFFILPMDCTSYPWHHFSHHLVSVGNLFLFYFPSLFKFSNITTEFLVDKFNLHAEKVCG